MLRYEIVEGDIMNEKIVIDSFYENGVFLDFYQILEVNRNASSDEIKKNYRSLSKIYHPDSKQGNEKKMQQIGTAYRILKNEETRKLYDSYYLNQGKKGSTNQEQDIQKNNQPKHTFSSIDYSSTCFSWNYIRELLKKCHYSNTKIDGFIAWCQRNAISISSGSELSSRLREYDSLNYVPNQIKRTYYKVPQQENRVFAGFSNLEYSSVMDFMFYRQMMVRQMIVASLFNQYLENSFSFFPLVSNLQIYETPPVRMTLYSYVPDSRVVFCSRPKIKYYY